MPAHRSAMGKQIDMTTLMKKNERVRAVGNMSVNARGDTIDSHGRIIKPVTEKVSEKYTKTVGNKSAQAVPKPESPPQQPKLNEILPSTNLNELEKEIIENLTDLEKELEDNLDEELEIERIKAKEQEQNGTQETSVQPNKNQKTKTTK